MHPELVRVLGRLKFRTSYGQNVLKHVVEASHIADMLASSSAPTCGSPSGRRSCTTSARP